MQNNFLTSIELFILVLACLNVFRNLFNVFKVMRLKEGKIELDTYSITLLGMSLSYIITVIILGF